MNAHALLTSQGWRGTGHSLHPTSDTTGLSKPLLVSQKANNLGVGKKQHRTSDMWWMNAFDKSLKGLDTSEEGKVVQTVTNGGLDMVVKGGARFVGKGGGLYASFVRGESLGGTITPEERGEVGNLQAKVKRKTDEKTETKEERRARKAARRAKLAQQPVPENGAQAEEVERQSVTVETKEERRERRRRKKLLKAAEQINVEAVSEKAKKKKRRKQ